MRRLDCVAVDLTDARAIAGLDGIDDPVVLCGDQPVAVRELWHGILASAVGDRCERLVLLHPSWWAPRRVDLIVEAASAVAAAVVTVRRADLIGAAAIVIEIGAEVVVVGHGADVGVVGHGADVSAVGHGAEVTVLARTDIPEIVRLAVAKPSAKVVIDAPVGVPGGRELAAELRKALALRGIDPHGWDPVTLARSITYPADSGGAPQRRQLQFRAAAAVAALIAAAGVAVMVAIRSEPTVREFDSATASVSVASLVEGRVAVSVPALWTVERITAGPGSRRVQVSSPADSRVALHITQTYAPGTTLADAATVLARGIAGHSEGTFVDFADVDDVAGRPAVTYREIRGGRVVRWVVFVDGATRISIGCQSAPDGDDAVREACEQAVRSAREVQ